MVAAFIVLALYAGSGAGAESPAVTYSVAPGDTLWSITVAHYSPEEDPRPRIEAIREENGLTDYRVWPGMRLELPQAG